MNYKWLWCMVVWVFGAVLCVRGADGAEKDMEEVRKLTEVAAQGPEALLRYVRETKASAPLIYSQWYVDCLARKDPNRAKLEQARRNFGRKVVESLEAFAPTLRMPADSASRHRIAGVLLDLADWFGEQPGYGNAWIFSRLQDLATVPIAYLIADLSFPETHLTTMVNRLVDLSERAPTAYSCAESRGSGTDF